MAKKINAIDPPTEYHLHIKLDKICATQNMKFDKRTTLNKFGYEKNQTTTYKEIAPEVEEEKEQTKKPNEKRRRARSRKDELQVLTHCFQRNNGHIIEQIGGTFGPLKRNARRAAKTISLAKYKQPAIELIHFEPELVDLGKDENITLTTVMEPRSRGTTREMVFYETATEREFDIVMKVSKTCPLTGEEIGAILTAIKDYDGFGASRRGKIASIEIVN